MLKFITIVFVLVLPGIGSVAADETALTGDQIKSMISGKSVYWRGSRTKNEGIYYYGADGRWSGRCCAPMFNGSVGGSWSIKNNQHCQYWESGRAALVGQERCFSYFKDGDAYFRQTKHGERRSSITKIVKGNPDGV